MTRTGIHTKVLIMNRKQAENLLVDLRRSMDSRDYCEDVYLSIKGVGTKSFKSCAYFETESWLFLWTAEESFVLDKRDAGDFVFVPSKESLINVRKENTCS